MPILFRYLLREYAKIFFMCFAGLMTIYLVIDFFEKVRRFLTLRRQLAGCPDLFRAQGPAISFQIVPLAILMATLLTLGLLSRNNEITAMRSCGISLPWITSPFCRLRHHDGPGAVAVQFHRHSLGREQGRRDSRHSYREETARCGGETAAALDESRRRQPAPCDQRRRQTEMLWPACNCFSLIRAFHLIDMTEAEEARYADQAGRYTRDFTDDSIPTAP